MFASLVPIRLRCPERTNLASLIIRPYNPSKIGTITDARVHFHRLGSIDLVDIRYGIDVTLVALHLEPNSEHPPSHCRFHLACLSPSVHSETNRKNSGYTAKQHSGLLVASSCTNSEGKGADFSPHCQE